MSLLEGMCSSLEKTDVNLLLQFNMLNAETWEVARSTWEHMREVPYIVLGMQKKLPNGGDVLTES